MAEIVATLVKNQPLAESIDLSNQAIDDLQQLVPGLATLSNLRQLNLGKNRLDSLPDLSELTRVEEINLCGNPFNAGLRAVLAGLISLCSLTKLEMDLASEAEEDSVIMALPNLEVLNGICTFPRGIAVSLANAPFFLLLVFAAVWRLGRCKTAVRPGGARCVPLFQRSVFRVR